MLTPRRVAYNLSLTMNHSFFQKLLITIVAAAVAAGIIWVYINFVAHANDALNSSSQARDIQELTH